MKDNEIDIELLKATLNAGANALKVLLIINGTAALSILTFIGKLTEQHSDKIHSFSSSLLFFTLGIIFISVASAFTYWVQVLYQNYKNESKQELGKKVNIVIILISALSLGSFCCGVYHSFNAFNNIF